MKELKVTNKDAGQRLDKYLAKFLNKAPKSFIYKMLRKKNIKLNKLKADGKEIVLNGDFIQLYLADDTINKFRNMSTNTLNYEKLAIVYEDKNILICNKPIGMLSQKDEKNSISLIDIVIAYLEGTNQYDPDKDIGFRPGLCNRLDRNTSGLVIVGKNLMALQEINHAIKEHQIKKYYLTIVKGKVVKPHTLVDHWEKDTETNRVKLNKVEIEGKTKAIKTIIRPKEGYHGFTQLEVELVTGKSHQIRAHLKSIDHPILGDFKYGDPRLNKTLKEKCHLTSQLLHAYKLTFNGLKGNVDYLNNKEFIAEEPQVFTKVKKYIERRLPNDFK
ncbi:RluA family pseudouridine synthase [Vallitalea okinawensis]|uniref:RluA family pseudouridine synthase n=1 Tax=Vallitalea okinawensis TaxID=2078660 RepID=UPI000CFD4477|nr:RluA family pseudouridine synthase [Vallitalea okinawensis]